MLDTPATQDSDPLPPPPTPEHSDLEIGQRVCGEAASVATAVSSCSPRPRPLPETPSLALALALAEWHSLSGSQLSYPLPKALADPPPHTVEFRLCTPSLTLTPDCIPCPLCQLGRPGTPVIWRDCGFGDQHGAWPMAGANKEPFTDGLAP